MALSSTARLLFSAGSDGKVHIWDCISGACMASIQAHLHTVSAMILSQDEQWLYTASKDCSVNEWHVASLPGMQHVDWKSFQLQSQPHQDCLQPSDVVRSQIIVDTVASERHIVELEAQSALVESAAPGPTVVSLFQHDHSSPLIAVAPSMADVLSGVRSESSLSSVSDDDFDSSFSRISSAIERLQGSMRPHASPPAVNSNESDYKCAPITADSDMNVRVLQLAERVGRPQRLHILSKAKSNLMQQPVHHEQPLPSAHVVLDLGDVSVSSDEKSSPAFTSPARSPAIIQPPPSVVHGSLYMPVTSPQASPRQPLSRANARSAAIPAPRSPHLSQEFSPQELRARARRQQERLKSSVSSTKVPSSSATKRATVSAVVDASASTKLPVRLLRVSSPASASQVAAAAGASLLLPLPVQSKFERLSALAPSLVSKNATDFSDVRLLAPRPSPANIPFVDHAPEQPAAAVNSGMLVMSPDELQQLVRSAVSSAMSASVQPMLPSEASASDDVQPAAHIQSPASSAPPPAQSGRSRALSPSDRPQHLSLQSSHPTPDAMQNCSAPDAPALLRESRSAIVQTDGDELPRRAPSPLAQSTRQAINDAYNFSLPPSRHVQVLSVAPGVPAASVHMNSAGSMEARSVAVMRGQPPVAIEETLSSGTSFLLFFRHVLWLVACLRWSKFWLQTK